MRLYSRQNSPYFLLIAPEGIEIRTKSAEDCKERLLIAPEGIEMIFDFRR